MRFTNQIFFSICVTFSKQIFVYLILIILVKQVMVVILISHKEKFQDQKLH